MSGFRRPGPFRGRALWETLGGLCLSVLLLAPQTLGAQITLGIQGGLGRFSVKGDAPRNTSYTNAWGGSGGLILELHLSEAVALSFQPSWTQKGTDVMVDVKGIDEPVDSMDLSLDYLSLPVLLKVSTPRRGGFVTAGVDLGYLQSAVLTVGDSEETNVKDALETTDVSAIFGVGGTLRKSRPVVTLELRYYQSLLRVLPTSAPGGETRALPAGFRSSGWELTMGLLLPLGGGGQ
jgi:hypothetical protein